MTSLRWAAVATLAGIAALMLAAWLTQPALSHEWYSDRGDPVFGGGCCGGSDCAPVDPEWVTATADGYRLKMTAEQSLTVNPESSEAVDAVIPWKRVQSPPNGKSLFYACIYPHDRTAPRRGVICFFATPTM